MNEAEYMTAHLTAPADPGEGWALLFALFLLVCFAELAWFFLGAKFRKYRYTLNQWAQRCTACEARESELFEKVEKLKVEVIEWQGKHEHLIDAARRKGFLRDLMLPEDEYAEEERRNRHGVHADFQEWQERKRWEEHARDDGDYEFNYDIHIK